MLSKRESLGGRGLWRCGRAAAGDAPTYSPSDRGATPLVRPLSGEEPMKLTTPTRCTLLRTALATTALAAPSARVAYAAGNDAPGGNMVLAWHAEKALAGCTKKRNAWPGSNPGGLIKHV